MALSWIPDALKQQIVDAVINFIGKQAEGLVGEQISSRIRGLSSAGAMRKAMADAFERGVARFQREYTDIDEDLTDAILQSNDFWNDQSVQHAILSLISSPGIDRKEERSTILSHFETILPGRRNRERVDRAVTHLLRMVAEEVWAVPGASEVRQLYTLQMQRLSTEALRQQVELLRTSLQATTQLSADMRQALLQLTGAAEQRLLAAPTVSMLPQRTRPYHNIPQRNYSRFIGRHAEIEKLAQLLQPRSRHFLVTLDGIGGVGKSTLALEYAHRQSERYVDHDATDRFEAIVWVSAKRTLLTAGGIQQREQTFSTLGDLYRAIATVLEQPAILQAEPELRRGMVERALTTQRTLLIVDNLETVDDEELLSFLRELPAPTKVIVTTRHRIDIAYAIRLTGMPKEDALALMAIEAARKNIDLPVEYADDLFRRTGGIPLAVVWSIGLMGLGHGIEAVLRRLGSGHSDIARFCFTESTTGIQGHDAERLLLALALFDTSVSRTMLGDTAGLGEDEIGRDDGLALLEQLSLVNKEGERFNLLPLTRTFALEKLASQPALEQVLRDGWVGVLTLFARPYLTQHRFQPDPSLLIKEGPHLVTLAQWSQQNSRNDIFPDACSVVLYYYELSDDWSSLVLLGLAGLEVAQIVNNLGAVVRINITLAWIYSQQGKHEDAKRVIMDAVSAANQLNDLGWRIEGHLRWAQVLRREKAFEQSFEQATAALQIADSWSDSRKEYTKADVEFELGKLARDQGDFNLAKQYFEAARLVFNMDAKKAPFNVERGWGILGNLAYIYQKLGDFEAAMQIYDQALKFFRETGGRGHLATMLIRVANLEETRGNVSIALQYAQEALELSQKINMVQEYDEASALIQRLAR